jgi:hypothetical protein
MPRGHRPKPNAILTVGPPREERIRLQQMRQRRYSKKAIINALKSSNGLISATSQKLGCTTRTLRKYFERYPELDQELQDIRDSYIDLAESSLLLQVKEKNTQATIFLLKCLGKSRGWIDNPAVQLHAHVSDGSGNWLDIMKRVIDRGEMTLPGNRVIDVLPTDGDQPCNSETKDTNGSEDQTTE